MPEGSWRRAKCPCNRIAAVLPKTLIWCHSMIVPATGVVRQRTV
jgi:hypothetical protein